MRSRLLILIALLAVGVIVSVLAVEDSWAPEAPPPTPEERPSSAGHPQLRIAAEPSGAGSSERASHALLAAADKRQHYYVRVLRSDGDTPIAGAQVFLYRQSAPLTMLGGPVLTGADGFATLVHDTAQYALLLVRAPGFGTRSSSGIGVQDRSEPAEIYLRPANVLGGRVVDALTGASIPEARLACRGGPFFLTHKTRYFYLEHELATDTSAADGSYTLSDVPDSSVISVSARGYASSSRWVKEWERAAVDGATIELVPAVALRGRVERSTPQGVEGLAGVLVHACPAGLALDWHEEVRESRHLAWMTAPPGYGPALQEVYLGRAVRTDADGHFIFRDLPASGRFDLWARGAEGTRSPVYPGILVEPGAELTIQLERPAVLVITVQRPDGTPVPRPQVDLIPEDDMLEARELAGGADGIVRVKGVAPAAYGVTVRADDHEDAEVALRLIPGKARRVVVELKPVPNRDDEILEIRGTVVDDRGRAIVGAEVTVPGSRERSVLTDQNGRFLAHQARGIYTRISVRAEGFHPEDLAGWELNTEPVEVVLDPVVRLRVPIVVPEGATPPDSVEFRASAERASRTVSIPWEVKSQRTHFVDLEIRPWHTSLSVSADGYLPLEISLGKGLQRDRVLDAVVLAPGCLLTVRVVDPQGQPVEGAYVKPRHQGGLFLRVVPTDERGEARLPGLPFGVEVQLAIDSPTRGRMDMTTTLETAQETRTVTLHPFGRIDGQIFDQRGVPIDRMQVAPFRLGGPDGDVADSWATGALSGRFELLLTAGRYRLELHQPGAENEDIDTRLVEVESGGKQRLRIRLTRR